MRLERTTANAMSSEERERYTSGSYWNDRFDLMYYRYVDFIVRTVGRDAGSLIDVGTGNCPYLEWFDWIQRRVSVDIVPPYSSDTVEGIRGNIHDIKFDDKFDVCLCLQVLEHVTDAKSFARRLAEIGRTVVISVPYNWPEGQTEGHVHDPVDLDKLSDWVGRRPNYHITVQEPFRTKKHERLIAVYDADKSRRFNVKDVRLRQSPRR